MKKIVISEMNWPSGNELLKQKGFKVVYDPEMWKDRTALRAQLQDADALIVRNQTLVDEEILSGAEGLKVIGRLGVGLDNIDLGYAGTRGIPVVYGKNANATSVAEYVMTAVLSTSRLIHEAGEDVRKGNWNRKAYTGTEISGKTLGLIGIGEIGHRVAVRARAFGMRVNGYDPFVAPFDFPFHESGIVPAELETVFRESDYISLHVPLTAQTRNLVDKRMLGLMNPSGVLINTARGGIVHEADLAVALQNHQIRCAVLDVLEQEPPGPDHPLARLANCILTPHVAGLTEESQERVSFLVAREVISELEGNRSLCRVNIRT